MTVADVEQFNATQLEELKPKTRTRIISQHLYENNYDIDKLQQDLIKSLTQMPPTENKVDAQRALNAAERDIEKLQKDIIELRRDYDELKQRLIGRITSALEKIRLEDLNRFICKAFVMMWGKEKVVTTMKQRIEDFNLRNKKEQSN